MSRDVNERFADILAAIERCRRYRGHLDDQGESIAAMAYDAILRNLAVIGEAGDHFPTRSNLPRYRRNRHDPRRRA